MSHISRHMYATVALSLKDFHLGTVTLVKVLDSIQLRLVYAQGQTPQKYCLWCKLCFTASFEQFSLEMHCIILKEINTSTYRGKRLAFSLSDPTILAMFNINIRFKYSSLAFVKYRESGLAIWPGGFHLLELDLLDCFSRYFPGLRLCCLQSKLYFHLEQCCTLHESFH